METASKPVSDWGNTLYDGASGLGTFKADLGMVIALVVGCVLIVIGAYLVVTDDSDKYLRIKGVVVSPNCVKSSVSYDDKGRAVENFKCNMVVSYKINGKVYSKKIYMNSSSSYIKDEPIDLMVSKTDYQNVQLASMDKSTLGSVMVLIAVVVVALSYLNYYLTHNYKVFAAAQGANTVVGLFR
ncbi:hypothetical protein YASMINEVIRUS_158 [Yasminevirus sp. GU-2018]|uniref:DUF3592 domain-containing protein n=1 Tax=Yasminevirus sp. GU-2018 TaxID=2420051 RepID=A0A5K0U7B6_9VIRU|nr:hypothetical protein YASMINEVIRUS_158 [Yasminevirus sp. GU-2018]